MTKGRPKLNQEVYEQRILQAISEEPQSLSQLQIKTKIGYLELKSHVSNLISRGLIKGQEITLKRVVYSTPKIEGGKELKTSETPNAQEETKNDEQGGQL